MIQIEDITKSYDGKKKIIDKLSLKVKKGEIFGLLGVNGAGKTTLIKSMIGLQRIEQGKILLNGKSLLEEEILVKKSFYFLPDNYGVYKSITGMDWIRFVLGVYGIDFPDRKGEMERMSVKFEINNVLDSRVGTYSLGMLNKLGIMIGFLIDPPILILDEPMHGLDPYAIMAYRELLKDYAERGGTVFYSTHLIDLAHKLCTRIGILQNGSIIQCFDSKELDNIGDLETKFLEVTHYEAAH